MSMFPVREPSIDALRTAPIYFRYGSSKRKILIDKLTSDAMLAVYAALAPNPNNQAKFARMVAGDAAQLQRVVSFTWKHVKIGG